MAALKFSTLVYFVLICTCFEVNSVISKEPQLLKAADSTGVFIQELESLIHRDWYFIYDYKATSQVDLIVFKLQSTSGRNMDKLF